MIHGMGKLIIPFFLLIHERTWLYELYHSIASWYFKEMILKKHPHTLRVTKKVSDFFGGEMSLNALRGDEFTPLQNVKFKGKRAL